MNLIIKPSSLIQGEIFLPASKSYSIRGFIIAACGGLSKIINPSNSDDVKVSMTIARALGAKIYPLGNNIYQVMAGRNPLRLSKINVKESGTVLRLLLPLLSLKQKRSLVIGEGTLKGRPNRHLTSTLRKMGIDIRGSGQQESVPIVLDGGSLKGGTIIIDGSLSSQFISALLIACPQLREDSRVKITGEKIVSVDYITMTKQVLELSGVHITEVNQRLYLIKGKQRFHGLKNFIVPADYGLAAFFMAAAALIKSDVILRGNLDENFIQADGAICSILHKMGVRFQKTNQFIRIQGAYLLKAQEFSLKDCPDLMPIITVLALFAQGKTRIFDIGHVRAKESDRISALKKELGKVGAKIIEAPNEIIVHPQRNYKSGVILEPHRDHRLAMAFSILGLKIGVCVQDIECTAKSYPGFVRDLKRLKGVSIKNQN